MDTSETDLEIWGRVLRDETAAFGVFFDRYADAVYNFCFRRTADWSLAEETVSDVFVETWRRRNAIQLDESRPTLLPWLLGVATNVMRNRQRSLRRRLAEVARIERDAPELRAGLDPATRIAEEQEDMRRAVELLRRLPPHEREVLALYALGDLGYDEIGTALAIPVGTVRSRLARARARYVELQSAESENVDLRVISRTERT